MKYIGSLHVDMGYNSLRINASMNFLGKNRLPSYNFFFYFFFTLKKLKNKLERRVLDYIIMHKVLDRPKIMLGNVRELLTPRREVMDPHTNSATKHFYPSNISLSTLPPNFLIFEQYRGKRLFWFGFEPKFESELKISVLPLFKPNQTKWSIKPDGLIRIISVYSIWTKIMVSKTKPLDHQKKLPY